MRRTTEKSSSSLPTRCHSLFLKCYFFRIFLFGTTITAFAPRVSGFPRYRSRSSGSSTMPELRMEGMSGRKVFSVSAAPEHLISSAHNNLDGTSSPVAFNGRRTLNIHHNKPAIVRKQNEKLRQSALEMLSDAQHSNFKSMIGGRRIFPHHAKDGFRSQHLRQKTNYGPFYRPRMNNNRKRDAPGNKNTKKYQGYYKKHKMFRGRDYLMPDWLGNYDYVEESDEDEAIDF